MSPRVLFVDDDGDASQSLIRALKSAGLSASCDAATNSSQAHELFSGPTPPQVVVLDLSLEPHRGVASGFTLLSEILLKAPDTRIIVLTGHGSDSHGIEALTRGAAHFLEKPADINHLVALIRDSIAQAELRARVRTLSLHTAENDFGIIGTSDAAKKLRDELSFLAQNDLAVFIRGETGVGKSLFAAQLHKASQRRKAPFVRYQPSYGNPDLVNSDLFGHKKGSFTGAVADRVGLLEQALGGTFFLDELDELPSETQITLLSVVQDKVIKPVGATQTVALNVRFISASNLETEQSLSTGKLRRDLFHRLAQETVVIPPLRERAEDIEPLVKHYLEQLRATQSLRILGVTSQVMTQLKTHQWPGNIRELEATIERAALRAAYLGRNEIDLQDLPTNFGGKNTHDSDDFTSRVERYKVGLIEDALKRCDGNQVKAAELLKLDRSTLRRILNRQ